MNANHSIITHINQLDTKAVIVVAKAIANNAVGRGIYATMQIIREREARHASDAANHNLVGKDLSAEEQTNDDLRDAPAGMSNKPTASDRLKEAAKAYVYANALIAGASDGNPFDQPQSVPGRMDWELTRLHAESTTTPKPLGDSIAARAAAGALVNRAKESFVFMQEWHGEIVLHVEGVFHALDYAVHGASELHSAENVAEDYVASLAGIARFQFLIICVSALARYLVRGTETVGRLRPGSPLARQLISELAVVEGAWKTMRAAALVSEEIDSSDIVDALMQGRNIRDLFESDRLIEGLGFKIVENELIAA